MNGNNISLCPVEESHRDFLIKLFKDCHPELESISNISSEKMKGLIEMQFMAGEQQLLQIYKDAELNIIMKDNEPIGRLSVNYGIKTDHIIEIGLLRSYTKMGIGKTVINEVIEKSSINRKRVSLQVPWFNVNAFAFYEKLGFKLIDNKGAFYEMMYIP